MDLLSPTLQGKKRVKLSKPPFRVASLVVVFFFGGPLAGTVCAMESARRMMDSDGVWRKLLVIAVAVILLQVSVEVALTPALLESEIVHAPTLHRRATNAAGLLAWSLQARSLTPMLRRALTRTGGDPGSLWGWGLAAVILVGTGERITVFVIVSVARLALGWT